MVEKGMIRVADKLQALEYRFGVWRQRNPEAHPYLTISYNDETRSWTLDVSGTMYKDRNLDDLIQAAFPYKSYM